MRYWCRGCFEWQEHGWSFFSPRCDRCSSELVEEESVEAFEVDYRELDIGYEDKGSDWNEEAPLDEENIPDSVEEVGNDAEE